MCYRCIWYVLWMIMNTTVKFIIFTCCLWVQTIKLFVKFCSHIFKIIIYYYACSFILDVYQLFRNLSLKQNLCSVSGWGNVLWKYTASLYFTDSFLEKWIYLGLTNYIYQLTYMCFVLLQISRTLLLCIKTV